MSIKNIGSRKDAAGQPEAVMPRQHKAFADSGMLHSTRSLSLTPPALAGIAARKRF
ncbi:hypothetical protein BN2475_90044 [Paraburkholderia ribeironis]|uniref:Uncharacterized protein n=1 Tax=Paraburkholderia ribeironis TaxID=1247936 RepID=A0A1N7RN34_9BURK|nr:hypothetical protein BN2475_90044 [Paraburkholderia ribeironis]